MNMLWFYIRVSNCYFLVASLKCGCNAQLLFYFIFFCYDQYPTIGILYLMHTYIYLITMHINSQLPFTWCRDQIHSPAKRKLQNLQIQINWYMIAYTLWLLLQGCMFFFFYSVFEPKCLMFVFPDRGASNKKMPNDLRKKSEGKLKGAMNIYNVFPIPTKQLKW